MRVLLFSTSVIAAVISGPGSHHPAIAMASSVSGEGKTVRVGLMGAAFQIPVRCTVSCVADVALSGGVSCWEPSDHQDLSGSFTLHTRRTVERTLAIAGERRVGAAHVYWGTTPQPACFCAVASLPARKDGGPSTWQFCTQSSDAAVRGYLRAIAESVDPDPGFTARSPCTNSL